MVLGLYCGFLDCRDEDNELKTPPGKGTLKRCPSKTPPSEAFVSKQPTSSKGNGKMQAKGGKGGGKNAMKGLLALREALKQRAQAEEAKKPGQQALTSPKESANKNTMNRQVSRDGTRDYSHLVEASKTLRGSEKEAEPKKKKK